LTLYKVSQLVIYQDQQRRYENLAGTFTQRLARQLSALSRMILPLEMFRLFFNVEFVKMKIINLFLLLSFLLNLNCGERNASKKEAPKPQVAGIKFQSQRIDAGVADGKANIDVEFRFLNTGNAPLTIKEVKGACHCVQGKWPQKPVEPGDSSLISVSFDPVGVSGNYQRSLTVQSNASDSVVQLYITGDIKRDPKEVIKKSH
jgi:hypothetical protein